MRCKYNIEITTQEIKFMDALSIFVNYWENFLDNFLLCVIADKVKMGIFHRSDKFLQCKLVHSYRKTQYVQKNAFMLTVSSEVTEIHPILSSEVVRT